MWNVSALYQHEVMEYHGFEHKGMCAPKNDIKIGWIGVVMRLIHDLTVVFGGLESRSDSGARDVV